jgi:hypothetical protein
MFRGRRLMAMVRTPRDRTMPRPLSAAFATIITFSTTIQPTKDGPPSSNTRGSSRQTDYGIAIMGLAGGAEGAPHVALAVDNQDEPDTKAGQLPGAHPPPPHPQPAHTHHRTNTCARAETDKEPPPAIPSTHTKTHVSGQIVGLKIAL